MFVKDVIRIMGFVIKIIMEQLTNIHLILRIATYEMKSSHQMHYLGFLWQIVNPTIQIIAYWFVFGMGIRGGKPVGDVPFFVWLIIGLIPWFFISPSITQGSNSVFAKINLVSKMKFPISVLPTITIVKNTIEFFYMSLFLIVILIINDINPGIYLLQIPYYIIALFIFLFSATLLFSTISVIIRDFDPLLNSIMRMLFFVTPILWVPSNLPSHILNFLKLNPFYYLIEGFRNTLLNGVWFFDEMGLTIYFWSITLLLLFLGAFMHYKFRKKFVDYL